MRLLAMDLGTGTQDVLLYDSERSLENCVKYVFPSPAKVQGRRLEALACDVHLTGPVVGGGPLVRALKGLMKRGFAVSIHPDTAATIKNDPTKVEARGIVIREDRPPGSRLVVVDELRLGFHLELLQSLGEAPPDGFAFALQDHGHAGADERDREYRFARFAERIVTTPRLMSLAFTPEDVPPCFLRLNSAARYARALAPGVPVVLMDTCPAALLGALGHADLPRPEGPLLVINVGNSHLMAALMAGDEVLALFEHHTRDLRERMDQVPGILRAVLDGRMSSAQVLEDGGGGALVRPGATSAVAAVWILGPRRQELAPHRAAFGAPVSFPHPGGDMMMTGPLGLVAAFQALHGR